MAVWKTIIFTVIAVGVVLVLIETAARYVEPRFEPVSAFATEEISPVILNPKEPGELRVFAYGGSTVEGDRGGCDSRPERLTCFLYHLGFLLEKGLPGKRITIGNFGKAGRPSSYVCAKIAATFQYKPDILIVLTGHNEYLTTLLETEREAMKYLVRRRLDKLALSRLIRHGVGKMQLEMDLSPELRHIPPMNNHEFALERRVEAFKENIDIIIRFADQKDIPLLLCTAPSNIRDWPPLYIPAAVSESHVFWNHVGLFTFTTRDTVFEDGISDIRNLLADGETDRAETVLVELSDAYPEEPLLYFLWGRFYLAKGSPRRAARYLVKARDTDPFPNRASTRLNDYIRHNAAQSSAILVDADSLLARHSPDGIPGLSLVADNCHPSPEGNALLANELFSRIMEILPADFIEYEGETTHPDSSDVSTDDFFEFIEFEPRLRGAHYLCSAKYCMKTPFMNYRLARDYLELAGGLLPDSWEVSANLATIDLLEGRREEGISTLHSAIDLLGDFPDLTDRITVPYLEDALIHADLDPDDF